MRFLRRKTNADSPTEDSQTVLVAEEAAETTPAGYTPGKGRPTPKRREAEARRRGPVAPPPKTQREAIRRMRGNKEERRRATAERRERMMSGDDRYLLPRDRGPVRAYVRDLVDSRRNLMGLFMPLALLVFVSLVAMPMEVQQYSGLVTSAMLIVMIVEGVSLGRMIVKRVRLKFPDSTARGFGLGWYAFTRATQIRKLRVPRPRVTPKDAKRIWS
ncbi:DUF3043 domain-containing protein [Actinoalloteichus sp. AHMU CJ021]|uniref:DUF3043 family protein n=1 Tax=Actinoalloteichus caeruleus DSM 43889 TaxID=1120930 RepID=A0ABT1JHD5_ACTCY|nr:DUF3043 domain-containing protein [Actinoalloteichus caeruleus]AUS77936.1 DUF3043 domain-containing protein [Actinoalloteichus sp. AHMU CJ021]MCP2331902.1 Protein of unknown function (DUF3043) [Actinoalloteichus caeruleus DSM 43889]